MSVARGAKNSGWYGSNLSQPIKIDCNFVVDSMNGNGLGIRSLKSNGWIRNVFMNVANGVANTLPMGTSRTYGILGASAVTNTGSSAVTGNLGLYPGTSVTGFPPGTLTGVENVANVAAQQAQASALAAYNAGIAKTPTPIAADLGNQTLTAGVYSESSGTFSLAGNTGTLTLSGPGVFIFQASSTLVTGSAATPTITLTGGALASNVYWLVGSSATLNSGHAGTFYGNVIAVTSITDTSGGTINGSLVALNGAVTLSAAANINVQALVPGSVGAGNPDPAPGYALIQFKQNFNIYVGGFSGFVSPVMGSPLTSTVAGSAYIIASLGTTSLAQWQAAGVPKGLVPAVGMSFIAIASGSIGGSAAVIAPGVSGVNSVEVIGDPNLSIANSNIAQNGGAWVLVQFLSNGVLTAPANNSVVGMSFFFDQSSADPIMMNGDPAVG